MNLPIKLKISVIRFLFGTLFLFFKSISNYLSNKLTKKIKIIDDMFFSIFLFMILLINLISNWNIDKIFYWWYTIYCSVSIQAELLFQESTNSENEVLSWGCTSQENPLMINASHNHVWSRIIISRNARLIELVELLTY